MERHDQPGGILTRGSELRLSGPPGGAGSSRCGWRERGFRMVVRGDPSGPDVATLQEPVELVRNLLSGLMTVLGISGHGLEDDGLQVDRKVGLELPGLLRHGGGQLGGETGEGKFPGLVEGATERQGFEEGHAQRVEIAEDLVGRCLEQPLRSHVHGRARAVAHLLAGGDLQVAAQSQVAEIDATGMMTIEQDVRRLDVAVSHTAGVNQAERRAALDMTRIAVGK